MSGPKVSCCIEGTLPGHPVYMYMINIQWAYMYIGLVCIQVHNYTEKETECFNCCNIVYKSQAILMKFGTQFLI